MLEPGLGIFAMPIPRLQTMVKSNAYDNKVTYA